MIQLHGCDEVLSYYRYANIIHMSVSSAMALFRTAIKLKSMQVLLFMGRQVFVNHLACGGLLLHILISRKWIHEFKKGHCAFR